MELGIYPRALCMLGKHHTDKTMCRPSRTWTTPTQHIPTTQAIYLLVFRWLSAPSELLLYHCHRHVSRINYTSLLQVWTYRGRRGMCSAQHSLVLRHALKSQKSTGRLHMNKLLWETREPENKGGHCFKR